LIVVRAMRKLFERMYRIKGIGLLGATVMFCPKCGLQNPDETKFCRGCGAELSNVLAAVDGKLPGTRGLAEKYIDLNSSGIRGVLIGLGFAFISWVVYTIPPGHGIIWTLFLAFAFFFLGTGISRLVQARGIKALSEREGPAALPPGQTEYIQPSRSIYQTDDLAPRPPSVTEHTTTHLKLEDDSGTFSK